MRDSEGLIPVGKIIGTHGIKGQLKVYSYSGNFESMSAARSVVLKSADGTLREFTLTSFNANSGKFIIGLQDFDDIDQAKPLVGNELCLKRSLLPELTDDEYYWSDLIGLQVLTDDGTLLGTIADIFETGSSDIYVVRGTSREYLIPAIGDVIQRVDLVSGRVIITPLDGLLDL
ncbi:MAG: ribosome maturation factor RimM [Geobacteraceae bacterium]|nr:ribosome maturation factor RimM [Geobacteraceae bacterium]